MNTSDRFITLARLVCEVTPFFWVITVFLVGLLFCAMGWQLCRSRGARPDRCAFVLVGLAAVPFLLLWFGARMMHWTGRTPAPLWPSGIILLMLVGSMGIGIYMLRCFTAWRGVLATVFALEFWLVVACALVAEVSVSGDYYRWLMSSGFKL